MLGRAGEREREEQGWVLADECVGWKLEVGDAVLTREVVGGQLHRSGEPTGQNMRNAPDF